MKFLSFTIGLSLAVLSTAKVIQTSLGDVPENMPEDIMVRASEIVHQPREDGAPLRFFMTTKYVTQTETQLATTTLVTYNTCYFTEEGILPCNRKRKQLSAVDSRPFVEVNGEVKDWEEILPTRVSRASKLRYKTEARVLVEEKAVEEVELPEDQIAMESSTAEAQEKKVIIVQAPNYINDESAEKAKPVAEAVATTETTTVTTTVSTTTTAAETTSKVAERTEIKNEVVETPEETAETVEAVEAVRQEESAESRHHAHNQEKNDSIDISGIEGSLGGNNWIEREVLGLETDCFDPANIAQRFLTILETRILLTTSTVTNYQAAENMQTVRFAANGNACLPTDVYKLFSTRCV